MNRRVMMVAITTSLASLTTLGAVALAQDRGPQEAPTPPWIREGGVVDLRAMPAWMPVSGPDGEALVSPDGLVYAVPSPAYATQGSPPVPKGMIEAPSFGVERYELPPPPPPASASDKNQPDGVTPDYVEDVYIGGGTVTLWEEIKKNEAEGP